MAVEAADVLRERVAILSPHYDDAVFSLGASIAAAAAAGAEVAVVTVLGGDASSSAESGRWDARAGFATAGEATRARSAEDDAACRVLGASSVQLPYGDREYTRSDDDEVWLAIRAAVAHADTVLVPGLPLTNPDHEWLSTLVLSRKLAARKVGLYLEQPYALWSGTDPALEQPTRRWTLVQTDETAKQRKLSACREYRSQLPLLGGAPLVLGVLSYEARRGGESIAWL